MTTPARREPVHRPRSDMTRGRYLLAHGIYLGLYGLVKGISIPLFNHLRFAVIRLFSRTIHSRYIADGVLILFPWRVRIGRRCSLNQGTIIDGFGGVTIGTGVRIAAYAVINTADHDVRDPDRPIVEQGYLCAPVEIEDDVWIGSHVSINKGVRIGKGAVVGSGSVVTRDVPPDAIVAGVPARIIAWRGGHRPGPAMSNRDQSPSATRSRAPGGE